MPQLEALGDFAFMNINDFRTLSGMEILFSLFLVCGAICPGILTIWLFDPQFAKDCGTVNLIVFGSSLTLPIICLNSVALLLAFGSLASPEDTNGSFSVGVFFASLVTMGAIVLPLLISFFSGLTPKWFAVLVLVFEILLLRQVRSICRFLKTQEKAG